MEQLSASLDDLFTTYKQYKQDTEDIASWLVQTGLECGHQLEKAPLRGKNRELAKKQSAAKTGPRGSFNSGQSVPQLILIRQYQLKIDIDRFLAI